MTRAVRAIPDGAPSKCGGGPLLGSADVAQWRGVIISIGRAGPVLSQISPYLLRQPGPTRAGAFVIRNVKMLCRLAFQGGCSKASSLMEPQCPFCNLPESRAWFDSKHSLAFLERLKHFLRTRTLRFVTVLNRPLSSEVKP